MYEWLLILSVVVVLVGVLLYTMGVAAKVDCKSMEARFTMYGWHWD